jgi:hypothetical protein
MAEIKHYHVYIEISGPLNFREVEVTADGIRLNKDGILEFHNNGDQLVASFARWAYFVQYWPEG